MFGTFGGRTTGLSISGETAKAGNAVREVYFKGNFYLTPDLQARALDELLNGHSLKDIARRLPGQFVIVIHDKVGGALTLVRDHIGQQPLYYRIEGEKLLFASSVRELRTLSRDSWSVNMRTAYDYFAVKYAASAATLIDGVSELTPGTLLEFRNGKASVELAFIDKVPATPLTDLYDDEKCIDLFKNEFERSFAATCSDISSRRFAVLSSGGIDSSMLVGAFRKVTKDRFPTFYVGCTGYKNDKAKEAEFISGLFNTEHRNYYVDGATFADRLPETIEISDFPLNSPSTVLRTFLYAQLKGEVDVLLSGEGADCLYSGYYIFDLVYRFYIRTRARSLLALLTRLLPLSAVSGDRGRKLRLVRQAIVTPPDEYFLGYDTVIGNNADKLSRMFEGFDESCYLPDYKRILSGYDKSDILNRILSIYQSGYLSENLGALAKCDTAFDLEHRHPFISGPMRDAFNKVSWDRKVGGFTRKKLIVELAKEYLPQSFFNMPKEGFGVPVAEWFRETSSLGRYIDLINSQSIREAGLFKKAYIDKLLSDYQNNTLEDDQYEGVLWPMVNYALWAGHYTGARPESPRR